MRKHRICLVCLVVILYSAQAVHAVDAYVGSNADGKATLYRIAFAGVKELSVDPVAECFREPGAEFSSVILRPLTSQAYCFIGKQMTIVDTRTGSANKAYSPMEAELEFYEDQAAFSPQGNRLYILGTLSTVSSDGIRGIVLDTDSLKPVAILNRSAGQLFSFAFCPESQYALIARDNAVKKVAADSPTEVKETVLESVSDVIGVCCTEDTVVAFSAHVNGVGSDVSYEAAWKAAGREKKTCALFGKPLIGHNPAGQFFFSYAPRTQKLFKQDLQGRVAATFSAPLADLLPRNELQPVKQLQDATTESYLIGGTRADALPVFTDGVVSMDGKYAILSYNAGIRVASYVAIIDLATGIASPAARVGKIDGGISPVVFAE